MAIRPPKYTSQGFTLIEMIVVIGIVGIVMGFAVPSLLTLNKPLRDSSLQMKANLSLIRSKAISSSKSYRIKPKFTTRAEYDNGIPHNFVVEYASNCQALENNAAPVAIRWQEASQFNLDLVPLVGITDTATATFAAPVSATITNNLNWNICFDSRGIVNTPTQFVLKDFQGNNQSKIAVFSVGTLGIIDLYTYADPSASSYGLNTDINDGQVPPLPKF